MIICHECGVKTATGLACGQCGNVRDGLRVVELPGGGQNPVGLGLWQVTPLHPAFPVFRVLAPADRVEAVEYAIRRAARRAGLTGGFHCFQQVIGIPGTERELLRGWEPYRAAVPAQARTRLKAAVTIYELVQAGHYTEAYAALTWADRLGDSAQWHRARRTVDFLMLNGVTLDNAMRTGSVVLARAARQEICGFVSDPENPYGHLRHL